MACRRCSVKAPRLVLALVVAVAISGVFTLWLGKHFSRARATAPQVYCVATTRALEAGDMLKATDLKMIPWPGATPLQGTFTKAEEPVGRTVLYPLAADEPVLAQQLTAAGVAVGLSAKIPDGMRALSLKSDQVVGVAGFLLPGTHVDVLVTYRNATTAEPVTATVLQDARVIAAGQKIQPDPEGKPSTVDVVTLLVTPEDAQKAVLASTQGTVHFVLRNAGDHVQVEGASIELSSLGGASTPKLATPVSKATATKPQVAAVQIAKGYSVQVQSGEKLTTESFQ